MSSIDHRSPRSPMKALRPLENIPRPVQKSKQLGIDIFTKKRELENDDHATNPPAKKAKVELNDSITVAGSTVKDGVICHHCRRHVGLELTVQCTHLRTKEKRCGAVYCQRCLCNRYNDLMAEIKSVRENREDHVDNAGYTWSCYRCRGICRCSKCKQTMAERAARQAASLTSPKGKVIKKPKERPVENGIQAFFGKADTTVRQKKEGVSKSPVASNTGSIRLLATVANPIGENKPKKPVLKLPETPSFQPVRAAGTDLEFSDCLKIREFVLTFEKFFTRKLHVPTKHVVQLADPCELIPALTLRHLYTSLLKMIQLDIVEQEEQSMMKETLRKVEKSSSGSEISLNAIIEWLQFMDPKHEVPQTEVGVACKLIDWAIGTFTCRAELDANVEKLKTLKSDHAANIKTLKTEYDERRTDLNKQRLQAANSDDIQQWKQTVSEVDKQYKQDTLGFSNELWNEGRRLAPRTACLGTDVLGNRYWIFSTRKTKERDFGGWLYIQTPSDRLPTGEPIAEKKTKEEDAEEEDEYSDLKSWYYVDKAEDIRKVVTWVSYLAVKASLERGRQRSSSGKGSPTKGSPNKLGQTFAVEVPKQKIGKKVETMDIVGTRLLCDELIHVAEWIEERWPENAEADLYAEGDGIVITT